MIESQKRIMGWAIAMVLILSLVMFAMSFSLNSEPEFYNQEGEEIENLTMLSGIELNKSLESNSTPLDNCYDKVKSPNQTEEEYWEGMCDCLGENLCLGYLHFNISKEDFTESWVEASCVKLNKKEFDCQGQIVRL